jgi:hypothetical protein
VCVHRGPSTNKDQHQNVEAIPASVPPYKPCFSPADARPAPPDDRGEDDLTFFTRRPNVNTRTRLPFQGEFPAGLIDAERIAFVHVVTLRDPLTNEPTTRGRGVFYADERGTA